MERWAGKVAVVTGASGGIGKSIALALAKHGLIVVALARRPDKLQEVANASGGKIHAMKCDVSVERDIEATFRTIEKQFGGVDLLVNNAACLNSSPLQDGSYEEWKNIVDTNVLGLTLCSKEALKTMKKRENGQIINVNSIAGHTVLNMQKGALGMYGASKFAVTALTKALRFELRNTGSHVRVTSISPGLVHTDMGKKALETFFPEGHSQEIPGLTGEDLADTVVSVLSLNPRIEIQEITLQNCVSSF